jgi:HEAT repeat protein
MFLLWQIREEHFQAPVSQGDSQAAEIMLHLQNMEAVADEGADAVPELMAELRNPDPRKRRNALMALRRLSRQAAPAIGPVRELLNDSNVRVRAIALDAYWTIQRNPDEAALLAAPMLADPDPYVRSSADKVLREIGPSAAPAIFPLLQGDQAEGRLAGVILLAEIGWDPSLHEIDEAIRELLVDDVTHLHAIIALALHGQPNTAELRELLLLNFAPQISPTSAAFGIISRRGPAAIENLPDVLDMLADPKTQHFTDAILALRAIGPQVNQVAPALSGLFEKLTPRRRIDVAWLLFGLGEDPRELVPRLIPLLDEEDMFVPFHAGRIIAWSDPSEARRQVARLVPRIRKDLPIDRQSALAALAGLAPVGDFAIPGLCRLAESDPELEIPVMMILAKMGTNAAGALPTLRRILARPSIESEVSRKLEAARVVANVGPAAQPALPELIACLEARLARENSISGNLPGDFEFYRMLLAAVISIGDANPAVVSALRNALPLRASHLHVETLLTLALLAPDAPELPGEFENRLHGRNQFGRMELIYASCRLTSDRRALIPVLVEALDDPNPDVRQAAAWTLGVLGPVAKAAIPALREAQADHNRPNNPPFPIPEWMERLQALRFQSDLSVGNFGNLESVWNRFRKPALRNLTVAEVASMAIAAIDDGVETGTD